MGVQTYKSKATALMSCLLVAACASPSDVDSVADFDDTYYSEDEGSACEGAACEAVGEEYLNDDSASEEGDDGTWDPDASE